MPPFFKKIHPLTLIFFVALILSLVIKILSIWGNNFPFTYDQGRDLVDLRQMVVTHTPRLVGPTTSINGVLLGPFYYYFLLLPFVVFGGSPLAIVLWQIIWYQLAVLILWFVLKKKSGDQANIVGIILALLPTGFYTARYFWNANAMPIFTILFIASLVYLLESRTPKRSLLLGLVSGLSLQIEAAFGILFFPFALLILLLKRFSLKNILACLVGFIITVLPQALFEVRHGFLMTKTLLAEFTGKEAILGEKLSFLERLPERVLRFVNTIRDTNHIPFEALRLIYPVLLVFGLYLLISKNRKKLPNDLPLLSLMLFIFSCLFYLIFPLQIKAWYVLGLTIPAAIFFATILERLFSKNIIGKILIFIFIFFTFSNTLKAHLEYLHKNFQKPSDNPSNLMNEIKAVDWVYQEAAGQGFRVYSYLPAIYDYPFQHAFWWYGTQKYGYQPEDIAYLPGQPEYIQKGELAWTKKKATVDGTPVFLIIQGDGDHSEFFQGWMGNFSKLCPVKETQIIDSLKVVMLSSCSPKRLIAK
jgi:hypothetical protein